MMSTLTDHLSSPPAARPPAHAARPASVACQICTTGATARLLALGRAPVVGGAQVDDIAGATAPLRLARCTSCGVLQLERVLDADARSRIATATSERTFAGRPDSARRFCEDAIDRWRLRGEGHIVEVGSGTGSLLRFFRAWQLPVLGIEPDACLTRYARLRRIPTWCATFDTALAERIVTSATHADLLVVSIPLGAFDQVAELFAAAAVALRPGGVATCEIPDVLRVVGHTRFTGIRHTDPVLPSLRHVQHMVAAHGMDVVDVERGELAGDRLRVWVRKREEGASAIGHPRLRARLRAETAGNVEHAHTVGAFASRMDMVRREIRGLVRDAAGQDHTVAMWGDSPQAMALTFAAGLSRRDVAFAVGPETVGARAVLPHTDIPVLGPTAVTYRRPDLVLALDDMPSSPRGWAGVPVYAVHDLLEVVHRLSAVPAVQTAR